MNLVPFNYEDSNFRTLTNEGEIYFIAADVTNILGYRDSNDALKHLDEDEVFKLNQILNPDLKSGLPVRYDANLLTESGLYSLILASKKPGAKQFKRWVTHEVLPSIRKTGSYSLQNTTLADLGSIQKMIKEIIENEVGKLHSHLIGFDSHLREVVKPKNKNLIAGGYKSETTKCKKQLEKANRKLVDLEKENHELSKEFRALTREYVKLSKQKGVKQ